MRALGRRAVDLVAGHMADPGRNPPVPTGDTAALAAGLLSEPLPTAPAADPLALVEEVGRLLAVGNAHPDHPGFLSFVPAPGTFPGVLGATLATGFAVPTGWRFTGAASSAVEAATVRWLVELLGLSPTTTGLFVSGGSAANLTALTAARDALVGTEARDATAYFSDQTHFSVPRALHVLGIGEERIRVLPCDTDQRLSVDGLAARVAADRRQGRRPFLVVANAGTTATGAVDPLPALARLCRAEGMWLHVDGALGAPAALTERGRRTLAGLDAADSLTVDPHKWLFQPAGTGCVLVRDPMDLRRAFGVSLPSYLEGGGPAPGDEGQGVDYLQWGVQQTREFRALRLWLSLKVFGSEAFRAAVGQGLDTAEDAVRFVGACPGLAVVTGPRSAVVTFRGLPPDGGPPRPPEALDRAVDEVCRALGNEGRALVTAVTVAGRRVFRLCTINPRIERNELRAVIARIGELWRQHRESPGDAPATRAGSASGSRMRRPVRSRPVTRYGADGPGSSARDPSAAPGAVAPRTVRRTLTDRGAPVGRLDPDALRAEASALTGLDGLGPDTHAPALDLLVTALEGEARLTPYGRAEIHDRLVDALCTRARLHTLPEPPVDPGLWKEPVFIVGLPRTGSTLLHALLSRHPALHAPELWELLAPVSPPGAEVRDLVEAAGLHVAEHFRAAPGLRAIHPTSARSPEECEYLMTTDFRNAVLGLISYRVPSYAAWLWEQDLTGAYRLHRAQLRHILARRPAPPGSRLVLKSPSHVWHLPSLAAVYPDARLIVLERDADAAVGSLCGLALAARRKRSDDVRPRELGRQLTAATGTALDRLREFTTGRTGRVECLQIAFEELAAAPGATAERVVAWLGLERTEEVRERWRAHLHRHPRTPHAHPRALCGLPPRDPPGAGSPPRP
ncbi:aminotransferase class V-fold PLP-dependent enzyme [Streptomyces tsukubensis]|uniref:aminotransferase class V-fold PLP-dependent enzyme n=1 Tax=Streptomyces tsukubensis TaxID=83656 RepID=UPI00344B26CE